MAKTVSSYPTAADIMDRVSPKFHQFGLGYECIGGGRINHDSKNQKIHIYGYSVVSQREAPGLVDSGSCCSGFSFIAPLLLYKESKELVGCTAVSWLSHLLMGRSHVRVGLVHGLVSWMDRSCA